MWSPRQLTHLSPAWHIDNRKKGPMAFSVYSTRHRYTVSNVESQVFTPNNMPCCLSWDQTATGGVPSGHANQLYGCRPCA